VGVLGLGGSCEEQKTGEQKDGFHGCLLSFPPTACKRRSFGIREGAAGALLSLLSIRRNGRTRRFIHLVIIDFLEVCAGREEKKPNAEAQQGAPERQTEGKKGFIRKRKRRAW
jgi:hypothetical protein